MMKTPLRTLPRVSLYMMFVFGGAALLTISLYLNVRIREQHILHEQDALSSAYYDLQSISRVLSSVNLQLAGQLERVPDFRINSPVRGLLAQGEAVVRDLEGRSAFLEASEKASIHRIEDRYSTLSGVLDHPHPNGKTLSPTASFLTFLESKNLIDTAVVSLGNRIQSEGSRLNRARTRTVSEERISLLLVGIVLLGESVLFGIVFFAYKRAGDSRLEEAVRTMESFRIENKLLELLSTNLPDLIFLKNGEGRWEYVNPEGRTFLGLDSGESWKGKTDTEIAAIFPRMGKILSTCVETDQRAWEKGTRSDSVEQIEHSLTGKTHVFSMIKIPLFLPDGKKDRMFVIGRDITEIVAEKEVILRQGEWYHALFSIVGDPLLLSAITPENTLDPIEECNQAASRVYGYSSGEFHRLTMIDLLDPSEHDHCLKEVFPRLLAEGSYDYESVHQSKDGRKILVEISARILEKEGKRFLLTLVHDKTLKEREKAIERMLAEADRRILLGVKLQPVLDDLCEALVTFFPFMYLGILKKESSGTTVLVAGDAKAKVRYEHSTPVRWDYTTEGMGVSGKALREGTTQMMETSDPSYPAVYREELGRVGIRFMWSIPFRQRNGEVLGTITSASRYDFGSTNEELNLLERYADRIGLLFDLAEEQKEIRFGYEALQTVGDAISMIDQTGTIRWVNRAFLHLTGYSREECIGQNHRFLKSANHDQSFYDRLWTEVFSDEVFETEIVNQRKDGSQYVAWQTISPLAGEDGKVVRFISVQRDITHRKENEKRIWKMANYDPLTGLANRNLLRERISHDIAYAKRNDRKVNLLFLDLDYFKVINDTLGHEVGDLLLKQVSEKLLFAARESDTVARLGGDEFVFVQPANRGKEDAMALNRRIQELFTEPFHVDGQTVRIGVSVGIVTSPEDGEDLDALLRKSDIALYQAKNKGRGRGECFQPTEENPSLERIALIDNLQDALERNEFFLDYQPVTHLSDGRMSGVESLIRWKRQGADVVLPSQFVFLLEETGMIHSLGEWVIREACRQAKAWQEESVDSVFRVAVNISAVQLSESGFVEMVTSILRETGVTATSIGLEFEITESRMMQSDVAVEALSNLRKMGIRISIDDFGTGYSSISLLRGFPVDTLKIDQSFIRDIEQDPDARSIIKAIVTMAKSLGLSLIAEGVEREGERAFLAEIGCDYFQGFLSGRPLPPGEILPFFCSKIPSFPEGEGEAQTSRRS
ncbi:MAG: bifunctional diguanylate cyclase/phosphodiesterase [Leptospirales bacterium]